MTFWIGIAIIVFLILSDFYYRRLREIPLKRFNRKNQKFNGTIAFFHPFCNDCGGGERVLWFMIASIQQNWPDCKIFIYSCDQTPPQDILNKAIDRFNVEIDKSSINFIYLKSVKWILSSTYPYFTMLGQSIGSLVLGLEARKKFSPDIFLDTTGFAFVCALFKLLGCPIVGAYVHYPTISTDMVNRVGNHQSIYNNSKLISKNSIFSHFKLIYYKIFSIFYWFAGSTIDFAMVNSQWTHAHIKYLWNLNSDHLFLVYPPCSPHFYSISSNDRNLNILSISQFRIEKNHKMQLDLMKYLQLNMNGILEIQDLKLLIVGGTRSEADLEYMRSLQQYAKENNINNVEFLKDVTFEQAKKMMSNSLIGIHTMQEEHFGIGVVEMLASGMIVIAHDSGGPKTDIIVDFNEHLIGFKASTVQEYASTVKKILQMTQQQQRDISKYAVESVNYKFSDKNFHNNVSRVFENILMFYFVVLQQYCWQYGLLIHE